MAEQRREFSAYALAKLRQGVMGAGCESKPLLSRRPLGARGEGSIGSEGEIVMKTTEAITLTILAGVICSGLSF
jgi:hypothetical protein